VRVRQVVPRIRARIAAALLLLCAYASADQIEYTLYFFNDNKRNAVATSSFSLAKTLWQRTRVGLDVELDQTTIPPLEPDAVTGASRPARQSKSAFRKNRGQILAGVTQPLGANTEVGGSYYFSQEVDYASQAVVGGITQSFADKNFTISLNAQYTLDSVGEILPNGTLANYGKETHQASLSIMQLLTPTSFIRLGADGMRNLGYLSDPYRTVSRTDPSDPLKTVIVPEHTPDTRYRFAGWAEFDKYLTSLRASYSIEYRYSQDDWNVKGHMVWLKLNKYITPDWIFSPQFRYYYQDGADFGDYAAGNPEAFFAPGDPKLGTVGTDFVGATVTCYLRAFARNHPDWDFLRNTSIAAKYATYFDDRPRPAYFSADILEFRLRFEF
jgi:hypothetical protein